LRKRAVNYKYHFKLPDGLPVRCLDGPLGGGQGRLDLINFASPGFEAPGGVHSDTVTTAYTTKAKPGQNMGEPVWVVRVLRILLKAGTSGGALESQELLWPINE